jgi:uncharacterized protein YyaL (SSP411 family)
MHAESLAVKENATPSGNAMAVTALLKLAGFTNDLRYADPTESPNRL